MVLGDKVTYEHTDALAIPVRLTSSSQKRRDCIRRIAIGAQPDHGTAISRAA
jgi:hypothetical protein